jgi:hypothetical protein
VAEQTVAPPSEAPCEPSLIGQTVNRYVKKKIFQCLSLLTLVPALLCGIGILDARATGFQVLCWIGLVASIVIAAILWLWIEKKLGGRHIA